MGRFVASDSTATIGDKFPNRVVYDRPGNHTFTVPSNVKTIKTTVVGGGGPGFEGLACVEAKSMVYGCYELCAGLNNYSKNAFGGATCVYSNCLQLEGVDVGTGPTQWTVNSTPYMGSFTAFCVCNCSTNHQVVFTDNFCAGGRCENVEVGMIAVGGAAGGYAEKTIKVLPGTTYNVVVGDGGETSSFGAEVSATGGSLQVNRCFRTKNFHWDLHCAKAAALFCRCTTWYPTYIIDAYEANTSAPKFVDESNGCVCSFTGGTTMNTTLMSGPLQKTTTFIDSVVSTPGQGFGGDVNKDGVAGQSLAYMMNPTGGDLAANSFGYCVYTCQYFNGASPYNGNYCDVNNLAVQGNTRASYFCVVDSYSYANPVSWYTNCTAYRTAFINCGPQTYYEDTCIQGAVPATEKTSSEKYTHAITHVNHWNAPFTCQRQENFVEKYALVNNPSYTGLYSCGRPFHETQCALAIGGTSTDFFVGAVAQTYLFQFTTEEGYYKYLADRYRFSPKYQLLQMLYCCDGLEFEDRLVTTDMNYRLSQHSTFCTGCYGASIGAHANNETYIVGEAGEERLAPSYYPQYDHTCNMVCKAQSVVCVNGDGCFNTKWLVDCVGVASREAAVDLIDRAYKHHIGDYTKILHPNAVCFEYCSFGTTLRPGFTCYDGTLAAEMAYANCIRKATYDPVNYDTAANTSGVKGWCSTYFCGGNSVANCGFGGAFTETDFGACQNSAVPAFADCRYHNAFETRPWIDPKDEYSQYGAGGNYGTCTCNGSGVSTFYRTCVDVIGKPSLAESCYKDTYHNAGQGGYSSWYKDRAKGKPGLVVVCY